MLGIILTGHGGFASGLEQAMKQILGEQPQFIAIDFPETSTTARLTTQLEQAVILLAACKAVVTNDSGLMHVAAALNRPLVALYGPSSPDFTPPLSNKARVIRLITGYHKVRKGDAAEGYHQSLIDITPQRVLEELNELLLSEEG